MLTEQGRINIDCETRARATLTEFHAHRGMSQSLHKACKRLVQGLHKCEGGVDKVFYDRNAYVLIQNACILKYSVAPKRYRNGMFL